MSLCNSQLFHSRLFLTADLCLRSRRPVLKSLCGILCYSFHGHRGVHYKSFLNRLYPSRPLPSSDVSFQNWFFDYSILVFSCSLSQSIHFRTHKFKFPGTTLNTHYPVYPPCLRIQDIQECFTTGMSCYRAQYHLLPFSSLSGVQMFHS